MVAVSQAPSPEPENVVAVSQAPSPEPENVVAVSQAPYPELEKRLPHLRKAAGAQIDWI